MFVRSIKSTAIAVAIGCLAIASPLAAQTAAASDPSQVSARYAACLVAQRPTVADAYLAAAPGSPARAYTFNALIPEDDADCASFATAPDGTQLQIPELVLTGLIAEARYITRYPSGAPPIISTSIPTAMTDQTYNSRITAAPDPAAEFPRIFGDCVVAARAQDVDQLIRSQTGSAGETAALGQIQPMLGQCLWDGQTLQFSRETLRAALADALYRKAVGVATTPTTETTR